MSGGDHDSACLRTVTEILYTHPVTDIDEQGRPEPPLAADEADTLRGFLDFHRATFA